MCRQLGPGGLAERLAPNCVENPARQPEDKSEQLDVIIGHIGGTCVGQMALDVRPSDSHQVGPLELDQRRLRLAETVQIAEVSVEASLKGNPVVGGDKGKAGRTGLPWCPERPAIQPAAAMPLRRIEFRQ